MVTNGKRIAERKRSKFTGRGREHSFLRLPHFLLQSNEFAELSGGAIKLLLDTAMEFRGANNGDINLAWSRLKLRGWRSQTTVQNAKAELLAAGFLICTRHGGKNRCSLYAVSWEPVDACEGKGLEIGPQRIPSQAWQKQNRCSKNWSKSLQNLEQSDDAPF